MDIKYTNPISYTTQYVDFLDSWLFLTFAIKKCIFKRLNSVEPCDTELLKFQGDSIETAPIFSRDFLKEGDIISNPVGESALITLKPSLWSENLDSTFGNSGWMTIERTPNMDSEKVYFICGWKIDGEGFAHSFFRDGVKDLNFQIRNEFFPLPEIYIENLELHGLYNVDRCKNNSITQIIRDSGDQSRKIRMMGEKVHKIKVNNLTPHLGIHTGNPQTEFLIRNGDSFTLELVSDRQTNGIADEGIQIENVWMDGKPISEIDRVWNGIRMNSLSVGSAPNWWLNGNWFFKLENITKDYQLDFKFGIKQKITTTPNNPLVVGHGWSNSGISTSGAILENIYVLSTKKPPLDRYGNLTVCEGIPIKLELDRTHIVSPNNTEIIGFRWEEKIGEKWHAVNIEDKPWFKNDGICEIQSPTREQSGIFRLVVLGGSRTNPKEFFSNQIAIKINPIIEIETQPLINQSICLGNPVSMSVVLNGNNDLCNFQWYRNGDKILPSENPSSITPTYTVEHCELKDFGEYFCEILTSGCVANNESGRLVTDNSIISQVMLPVISSTPTTPQTTTPNSTVTWDIRTSSVTSAQWLKNGIPLVDSPKYSGVLSSILTINNVTSEDAGFYKCVVANQCGVNETSDIELIVS